MSCLGLEMKKNFAEKKNQENQNQERPAPYEFWKGSPFQVRRLRLPTCNFHIRSSV